MKPKLVDLYKEGRNDLIVTLGAELPSLLRGKVAEDMAIRIASLNGFYRLLWREDTEEGNTRDFYFTR